MHICGSMVRSIDIEAKESRTFAPRTLIFIIHDIDREKVTLVK